MPVASVSVSSTNAAPIRRNSSRSSVEQRRQRARAARGAVLAVQPPLGERHQQRVQQRDGEQAVGEHREQRGAARNSSEPA